MSKAKDTAKDAGKQAFTPENIIDLCFTKVLEYERYENTIQQKAQFRRKLIEYRRDVMNYIANTWEGEIDNADGNDDSSSN